MLYFYIHSNSYIHKHVHLINLLKTNCQNRLLPREDRHALLRTNPLVYSGDHPQTARSNRFQLASGVTVIAANVPLDQAEALPDQADPPSYHETDHHLQHPHGRLREGPLFSARQNDARTETYYHCGQRRGARAHHGSMCCHLQFLSQRHDRY